MGGPHHVGCPRVCPRVTLGGRERRVIDVSGAA
jgi:hypothetical protein